MILKHIHFLNFFHKHKASASREMNDFIYTTTHNKASAFKLNGNYIQSFHLISLKSIRLGKSPCGFSCQESFNRTSYHIFISFALYFRPKM